MMNNIGKTLNFSFNYVLIFAMCFLLASCKQKKVAPPQAIGPVPDESQMAWHEMEMNAFIHFTINTFTDKEWGYGDESPKLFSPTDFNAGQWVSVLKEAGFKGVILTCKHHDGFCLWPTGYTDHSVKNSPFQDGKGDIVKAVSDACKKYGLKFGVYLSPWDRNRDDYGKASYVEYYRNQLRELFTNYGPIFEMWFDGANGGDGYYGGTRERRGIDGKTYYDWPGTLEIVRGMQPEVLFFSDAGPDLRWMGNERGVMGETNWNTITVDTLYAGKPGINELLNSGSEDGKSWVPGEVDTSIRPGWFYHEQEDSRVKTPEQLFDIFMTSVGRGSTLLLNIPPDKRGLLHENDVESLRGFRNILDSIFANDIAVGAKATASEVRGKSSDFAAGNVVDGNKETYWTVNDGTTAGSIELDFGEARTIRFVQLQEYIKLGQRVRSFTVEVFHNNMWEEIASGTTIGYKRIMEVNPVTANKLKITINDAKACPVISSVSVF